MKLGIDLTALNSSYSGGVATFALGLTGGLIRSISDSDRIVLFATRKNRDDLAKSFQAPNLSIVEINRQPLHSYAKALLEFLGYALNTFKLPYLYERLFRSARAAMVANAVDILIVPTSTLGLPCGRSPIILCVHDIQHEYHPEFFSFRERVMRWGRYRFSCWAASAVQASSQFVKDCLLEKFAFMHPDKIFIAPEGIDLERFSTSTSTNPPRGTQEILPGTFLFYPAQLWPHKNHLLLIAALAAFRDQNGFEVPCLFTGEDFGMLKPIREAIDQFGLSKTRYLGKIPFSGMLWLYANCRAVLALGVHESGSLPLKEGAVFGKPLICSDIPPNRELQRTLFLVPFTVGSVTDLCSKIELLMRDESIFQSSLDNSSRVLDFSWERITKEYIAVAYSLTKKFG
jgi:glycosyltransferase involved in cell wall biosynthesis